MSESSHTYGPSCHHARNVAVEETDGGDVPKLKAQYFYSSPLPIDDPLSVAPTLGGSDARSAHPLRPFSPRDNNALDETWLGWCSSKDKKQDRKPTANPHIKGCSDDACAGEPETMKYDKKLASKRGGESSKTTTKTVSHEEDTHKKRHARAETGKAENKEPHAHEYKNYRAIEKHERSKQFNEYNKTHHHEGAAHSKDRSSRRSKSTPTTPPSIKNGKRDANVRSSGSDVTTLINQSTSAGTSGQPFVKLPSKYDGASDRRSSTYDETEHGNPQVDSQTVKEAEFTRSQSAEDTGCKAHKSQKGHHEVPVGVSRLHMVKIPDLQMCPIYWSPVHDIATVTRGTWFYKDTMYPVEPAVANQLELGYRDLRPWSQTWKDELNSAMDVGAAGEEKVVHQLWPKDELPKEPASKRGGCQVAKTPYGATKCFHREASAEGTIGVDGNPTDAGTISKTYSSAKVIYINKRRAHVLKPTLQPSSYYGRKPIHKILKGINVGICVVRGFDWKSWENLHPSKKPATTKKAAGHAAVSGDAEDARISTCSVCEAHENPPLVRDLVLVVHGIGQKLSERVESFNFTHAINSFRRCVNTELANGGVQRVLREDCGGIMVLPVNWRSSLSFEDGGLVQGKEHQKLDAPDFSMKDITPESIPAVRNMISDVMLDIPFYMSHHKPRMIQAVICEANRVYRLWCKNNPEFNCEGRVHIIAHSLGSAMAVDILSEQPTFVPKIDLTNKGLNAKHFDFDCTNLFFAGSPAAFFLLLEKGRLLPRRGRGKVDAEYSDDNDQSIAGEAGTYGCMAVDNVYNIMHCNDPIAYRLNPTVDPQYAASLKPAQVPSASLSFFETIGKAVKSMTSGSSSSDLAVGEVAKPALIARLPSQLELDVHDFTREEIAEKKYYLLNDNGQIDWCLSSGGGPLEIQYINMLSAHSSYWVALDFIRMIVTECGRRPGKRHTLPNMRAAKIGHKSGQKS
ncbi:DDHD domain-containing protein [Amylocarpus encephaloides]|uniref:DDHD domain-containing protein n=1 Tax=Amylocarpus encephaloides TaxID=45428 RepID=A0A9P8C3L1_9HELO|nr:DDHD domain-containing protein [Amylocarpus encephaloides]